MERLTNSEGMPLDEIFSREEMARLSFERWMWNDHQCDLQSPQTPLTDVIPYIHIIDTANKGQLGEFFNRHKRRGPYKKGA